VDQTIKETKREEDEEAKEETKEALKKVEELGQQAYRESQKETLLELLGIFGLDFTKMEADSDVKLNELMDIVINIREQARKDKNYKLSDDIREKLRKSGIQLEDTPDGPRWKIV
ncbi:MAG: hypothetical protein ACFFE5_08950, partial [Candidatus Thorarchaeota archaeon]